MSDRLKMTLAVMKVEGHIPGGGYHYMLHPLAMENEQQAALFELIGYIVFQVPKEKGEELIMQARQALNHQVNVAVLTDAAEKKK